MKYHPNLSAARVRAMPWKTQVGMVASELSRAASLSSSGGGTEALGCLNRARELLGLVDSATALPPSVAAVLAETARRLSAGRHGSAASEASRLYESLMDLYRSA